MPPTAFDFTGIDDVQAGGQSSASSGAAFDFGDIPDAKKPVKAAAPVVKPPTSTTPAASPEGTVKFDFADIPAPSYKIQLEGTRPGDKAATGKKIDVAPHVDREVAQKMVDVLVPKLKDKFPKINPKDGKPFTQPGHLPAPGDSNDLAPGTHMEPHFGMVVDDGGVFESEMKPGWQGIVQGAKDVLTPGHHVEGVNKVIMGALTASRTPGLLLGAGTDPIGLLLGVGAGTGAAEVVERVGAKVGAQEDFTHLGANIVSLYAGAKGAGMVRGFESVANDAAATEAAAARAARMRAEKERVLPDLNPAITARQAAADAKVQSRLGTMLGNIQRRRDDLRTTADTLTDLSRGPSSAVRQLNPAPPPPEKPPVFSVDLPTGVIAAPEGPRIAQRAKSIETEVERPVMPEGVTLKKVGGKSDDYVVNYMSPSGPVSALIPGEQIGVRAADIAMAYQERTRFPATFGELPALEKAELRRVRMEMEEFPSDRSRGGEDVENDSAGEVTRADADEARRAKEGNLLKVSKGAPVLHDIIAVGDRRYTRPRLIAALQAFEKGGKVTQPVKDALVIARRRLSGGKLEGFFDQEFRPAEGMRLPEDAGFKSSDVAHIPGFEDLADPRAYLEAERDAYYKKTAVERVQQYLGEGETEARGSKSVAAVLKATPEIALSTRQRLLDLKADGSAWKSLTPDVRRAVESQLKYLDETLDPAMRARWIEQGQPGLTVFPKRNMPVVTENPVVTSVLPEPGTVGRPLAVVLEERGAKVGPDGQTIVRDGLPVDADRPAGARPEPTPNPDATPPADNVTQASVLAPPGGSTRPFDEPTIAPMRGAHRDLRGITTVAGPVEQVLLNHPLTSELMGHLLRGADQEPQFVYKYTRAFADTHKGLSRAQMQEYSDILNRFERPEEAAGHYSTRLNRMYSPEAIEGARRAREVTNEIYSQFPDNATAAGTLPQFIPAYLTHIERITRDTPDLYAGITQAWDHWYGGVWDDVKAVFTRDPLTTTGEDGRPVPPRPAGVGRPRSRFVEHRTGNMQDIELDPRVLWPIYVKSAARVIVDKPVVDRVRPLLESLPSAEGRTSSKLRDLATQVVRNYSRYDAYPELHRTWGALVRTGNVAFVRSVLGLSPRLAALHLARLQGVYAEMPNKYFWNTGLRQTLADPIKAFNRTAEAGLLPNNLMPPEYRQAGTKLDNLLNFMGTVDFFDRSVALHGFEKMYLDMGHTPAEAYAKAVAKTKKTVQFTDRVRYTFPSLNDSEIGKAIVMFKAIPTRILQQMIETARMAKEDPSRAARHMAIVSVLLGLEAKTDVKLIHLGSQLVHLEPPVVSEMRKIGAYLYSGDWVQAAAEAALSLTPGGLSMASTVRNASPTTKRAVQKALGTAQPLPGEKK